MTIHTISKNCAAFSLPLGELGSKDDMERLCRREMEKHKLKPWRSMHIDIFTSSDTALCLAYPKEYEEIHLAPYAIPFLREYFTE